MIIFPPKKYPYLISFVLSFFVSYQSDLLTVGAIFLPQGLDLTLGESSLGVHLEVRDALIEGLHVSVLHDEHLLLVSGPLEILWTVQRQIS